MSIISRLANLFRPPPRAALKTSFSESDAIEEARVALTGSTDRLSAASARLAGVTDELAAARVRLAELSAIAEPTSETLVSEATTQRRIQALEAQEREAVAGLELATAEKDAAEAALADATRAAVERELRAESVALFDAAEAMDVEFSKLLTEHRARCATANYETSASRVRPRQSDFDESNGLVGAIVTHNRELIAQRAREHIVEVDRQRIEHQRSQVQ
ncbi:MAG: hypothetical protein Q8L14_08450 [Myxococcales bacterium]|nr:hypothetical protein [Myxococcales bacterium]